MSSVVTYADESSNLDAFHYEDVLQPWPLSKGVSGAFALVVSNVVLAGVAVAVIKKRARWDVAVLLISTMISSIAYHACRAGFVCVIRYGTHQLFDHLSVNSLILYIMAEGIVRLEIFSATTSVSVRTHTAVLRARNAVYFAMQITVMFPLAYDLESRWVQMFSFVVPLMLLGIVSCVTKTPVFFRARWGWAGVALFVVSVIFYAVMPHRTYEFSHSIWHLLSMSSVYLIFEGFQRT